MNIKKIKIFALLLPLIIAGCGGGQQQYNAEKPKKFKINHLQSGECDFEHTQNGVTVRAKLLQTYQECIEEFGHGGRHLLRNQKPILPIKITFENKGSSVISLPIKRVSLKLVPRKIVINRVKKDNTLKIFAFGAGIIALSVATGGAIGCVTPILLGGVYTTAGLTVFSYLGVIFGGIAGVAMTPASTIIYGLSLEKSNKKKIKKINRLFPKILPSIYSKQTETFFIFVRQSNYKENFALSLADKKQEEIIFDIQLPETKIEPF